MARPRGELRAYSARTCGICSVVRTRARMPGDVHCPSCGAAGEQGAYRGSEICHELLVLVDASRGIALPAALAHLAVGQTLLLGTGDRVGFGQDALSFVPLAGPAPLQDHRGQPTASPRPARERAVAAWQELQMSEVGAVQAQRSCVIHRQELATLESRSAVRAGPWLARRYDEQVGRAAVARHAIVAPPIRPSSRTARTPNATAARAPPRRAWARAAEVGAAAGRGRRPGRPDAAAAEVAATRNGPPRLRSH